MASLVGVNGEVRRSYYVAAEIHGYTVTREGRTDRYQLTATVVRSNPAHLAQGPLQFVAILERAEWTWPILDHEMANGTLTARLGPPE